MQKASGHPPTRQTDGDPTSSHSNEKTMTESDKSTTGHINRFDFLNGKKLLLASASPRRRQLLGELGVEVHRAPITDVDESYPDNLAPDEVAMYISRKKAEAYRPLLHPDEILVTADTVVISGNKVLGKPADAAEAAAMLRLMSGRTHHVVTGVTLVSESTMESFKEITEVDFAQLTDREIDHYVAEFHPFDKAGAYGIQEWIGYIGISGIRGDYYNVMGLPLHALYRQLSQLARGTM